MPNENKPVETSPVSPEPDAATTPIDLASAFKMLNQANREATQDNLGANGDSEGSEPISDEGDAGTSQQLPENEGSQTIEDPNQSGDNGDIGGSSDSIQAIDFNAYKQEMLRDIQRNAQAEVRREFNEQNIGYYSASELTVRDEQSGQIRFRNPDVQDERDPNYYFKSRSEMQQFIEAWNHGVDFEFRKAVNEKQQEMLQNEAPKARLMDFMPKWQAMDQQTKNVFDALLEGHEIRDASGKEIGFNVNLDAVAAQAARIAKSFGNTGNQIQQTAQQDNAGETNTSDGPALDMQTGNGKSDGEVEPKNIGEALKMFDKKNKGGK